MTKLRNNTDIEAFDKFAKETDELIEFELEVLVEKLKPLVEEIRDRVVGPTEKESSDDEKASSEFMVEAGVWSTIKIIADDRMRNAAPRWAQEVKDLLRESGVELEDDFLNALDVVEKTYTKAEEEKDDMFKDLIPNPKDIKSDDWN